MAKEDAKPFEHKDYSLKEGQKITINLGVSLISDLVTVLLLVFSLGQCREGIV